MTQPILPHLRLYLVLDPDHVRGDVMETAQVAIRNGVSCVQLRWKTSTDLELLTLARSVRQLTRRHDIPLIVNDRLDIAMMVEADGVHLGVDDVSVADARRLAGADFLIGYSPETDAQVIAAADAGFSYLGIGPIFGTSTKSDAGPALGSAEFGRRRALTGLPVVAIGGIGAGNAAEAMAAGANGIAVASAILGSNDPAAATGRLSQALRR